MKMNDEILTALRRAINHYGNTSQFAKHIGVAHSTVLFWLSGKTTSISGHIWVTKVRKELKNFMDEPHEFAMVHEDTVPFLRSPVVQRKEVCILNFSAMKDFDCTLQSPVSFIKARTEETALFANEITNVFFALQIDSPDICPILPVGAKLLLSSAVYTQNGDLVMGKLRGTSQLFLCRCVYQEGRILMYPLNSSTPSMEWLETENAEKVFWMYPVLEVSIDLTNRNWEGNQLVAKN